MALLNRIKMDLHDKAILENAEAENARNAAYIEYIAMMEDIEMPTEEVEDGTQHEI